MAPDQRSEFKTMIKKPDSSPPPALLKHYMDVESFGPLEKVDCAICGPEKVDIVVSQNWFGERFHVVQCVRCKLMFTNPRPTPVWRENYNDPRRNPLMKWLERDFIHLENKGRVSAYRRLLEFFKSDIAHGIKLLDGGCAAGQFVKMARDAGFDATGVDQSPGALAYASEHFGLDLIRGDIEKIPVPDNSFDVVSLLEVFEHIADPMRALNEIKRILRPGGTVFIETPNYLRFYLMEKHLVLLRDMYVGLKNRLTDYQDNNLPWFPFDHLYHWSPKSLIEALNKAGFRQSTTHFIPNFNFEMREDGSLSLLGKLNSLAVGALFKITRKMVNLWGVLVASAVKP